jgi:tetratricopeptide (TPR) repeat protein
MPKKKRKTKARARGAKPARRPKRSSARRVSSRRKPRRKARPSRPARKKKAKKLKRSAKPRKPSKRAKLKRPKKAKTLRRPRKVIDPRVAEAMKIYAEGMKYFNKQSFRRARALFEKVASGFSRELAERARVHIAICEQRLQRPAPVRLRGTEDHYHYAVAKINTGEYDEANVHLHRALKLAPKADYVYYALATVAAAGHQASP